MNNRKAMAVINRTECGGILSIRVIVQGIILVLVLWSLPGSVGGSPHPASCEVARKELGIFAAAGWTALPDRPSNGGPICGEDSCCSGNLEQDLMRVNRHQIDAFLRDSITKLSSLIELRAKKFDNRFREMMNTSKLEFHDMFQKTYGKLYLQNQDIFSDFFTELDTYYRRGSLRLSDSLESFFGVLYQRMFTVLNSQYAFDEKYLECVSEHMDDLKPFGDIPHKLTVQLRRSFVATKSYHKALVTAAEAAKRMASLRVDDGCEREMVRMRHCGGCRALKSAGACSGFCAAVLEGCLRHHTAFDGEWNQFVDALDKVAERLTGPYNIEVVVEPLNIKISEAVMNFQDSGAEVSKRIFTLCGKPSLSRKRRKADPVIRNGNGSEAVGATAVNKQDNDNKKGRREDNDDEEGDDDMVDDPSFEIKYEPIKSLTEGGGKNGKKKNKGKKVVDFEDGAPSLDRLIKDIRNKIKSTRQFWAHLPYQFCNNASVAAPPSANSNCWNGTHIGEFQPPSQPSQKVPNSKLSLTVSEQIFKLQIFTDKLRKAYQGDEVEIVDESDDSSFDGSGSGSGDFEIEEETEDSIHVNNNINIDISNSNENNKNKNVPSEDDVELDVRMPIDEHPNAVDGDAGQGEVPRTTTAGADSPRSLHGALAQYLIPIVLVWFGGAISDLL